MALIKSPSGAGRFDVSTTDVTHYAQSTTLTLVAADMFKNHYIQSTVDNLDVYLPDGTTVVGGAQQKVLAIYSIGGTINLRYSTGKLFMRFKGRKLSGAFTRMHPNDTVGCSLDLITASAKGLWLPRLSGGTIYAPRIIKDLVTSTATMAKNIALTYPRLTNASSSSPGTSYRRSSASQSDGKLFRFDYNRFLEVWVDSGGGGFKCRVVSVATDGTITAGSVSTIDTYDNTTNATEALSLCCTVVGSGGFDHIVVMYPTTGVVYKVRDIKITTASTTISTMGTAAAWATTDTDSKTIGTTFIPYPVNQSCLVGCSSTQVMILGAITNSTDSRGYGYAIPVTVNLSTAAVTLSTPKNVGNTAAATGAYQLTAALVGNTSNRLAIFGNGAQGTGGFGGNNSTVQDGVVLDVSTFTTPTVSYRVPAGSLPTEAMNPEVFYDQATDYFYTRDTNSGANSMLYYKWQAGAAAVTTPVLAGALEFNHVREVVQNNVGGGRSEMRFNIGGGAQAHCSPLLYVADVGFKKFDFYLTTGGLSARIMDAMWNSGEATNGNNQLANNNDGVVPSPIALQVDPTHNAAILNLVSVRTIGAVVAGHLCQTDDSHILIAGQCKAGNGNTTLDTFLAIAEYPDAA